MVACATGQGFSIYLLGERGDTARKSTISGAARREQSNRTAEQMRASLEEERKRGMDAEHGRGKEREG